MSQPFLFDIPQAIEDYLVVLDDFIEREIKPLEAQDDNIRFLTTAGSMRARIGIETVCPAKTGKRCSKKCVDVPMRPGTFATRYPKNLVGKTAVIWPWRVSGST